MISTDVAQAFCLACATFGYVVSWGVRTTGMILGDLCSLSVQTFQEYYEKLTLADRSPSDMCVGYLRISATTDIDYSVHGLVHYRHVVICFN